MRILIVNDNGVEIGGVETYLFHLKKELKTMGHEVRVLTSDITDGKESFSDYTYQGVNKDSLFRLFPYMFNYSAFKRLKAVIRDFKPDIVHLHFIFYHTSPSILLLLQ